MWKDIIFSIIKSLFSKKVARETPVSRPIMPQKPVIIEPMPQSADSDHNAFQNELKYLFNTQEDARHSIRVLCDEAGLSFDDKNTLTACIYQESEFFNILPNGLPVQCQNKNKAGVLTSTDWGIVQINDTKGWYIGPAPLPFPSVQFLLDNPEKAVRFMIKMMQQGMLRKWVSYSSGAYKRWLPHVVFPVPASGHY